MNAQISARIDQLRALACLWVFVFHYEHFIAHEYFLPIDTYNPLHILVYNGYAGVSLFFCLSGFLFAHYYCPKPTLALGAYYAKRLLRILPSFVVLIGIFYSFLNTEHRGLFKLLSSIFYPDLDIYPQAIGHLWSINRELQCYALFPFLWLLNRYLGVKTLILLAVISLGTVLTWALLTRPIIPYFYGSFGLRFFEFVCGMVGAVLTTPNRLINKVLPVFVLIYFGLLVGHHLLSWQTPLSYSVLSIAWLCLNSVLCLIFIILFIYHTLPVPTLLSQALRKIGETSYSFYLYHFSTNLVQTE